MNSNRNISFSLITTMSGRAEESRIFIGNVAGGLFGLGGQQRVYPQAQDVSLAHLLEPLGHNHASRYISLA